MDGCKESSFCTCFSLLEFQSGTAGGCKSGFQWNICGAAVKWQIHRRIDQIDHEKGTVLTGNWQVPYEPGELTAIAYDENHQEKPENPDILMESR